MAFSVKVQNPAYPDDHTFEIVGLGEFKNGEEREVTEDQEKSFVSYHQMALDEAIGDGPDQAVTFSGSTTIENMDDVLGVDISDHTPLPEPESEEEEAPAPTVEEETPAPVDTGGEA